MASPNIALSPEELGGWVVSNKKLYKKFTFDDFNQAWLFMSQIAKWAEEHDHHPEWLNVYNTVEVWLISHDAGGVTQIDIDLARYMNEVNSETD